MTISKEFNTAIIITDFLVLIILGYTIWWNLPVSINRRSDIQFGNKLIERINEYKMTSGLPRTLDWKTLESLGFEMGYTNTYPNYQKIDDTTFELAYLVGFDGPYLLWNSNDKVWKEATLSALQDQKDIEDEVTNLVRQSKLFINQKATIDSLSEGKRNLSTILTLKDTANNIYLVKVVEDNGSNMVTYFNFLVDANAMTIVNPL